MKKQFLHLLCGFVYVALCATQVSAQTNDVRSVVFWKSNGFNYILPNKGYKISYTADSAVVYKDPYNAVTQILGFTPANDMPSAPADLVKYLYDKLFTLPCEKGGMVAERKVTTGNTISGVPYYSISIPCKNASDNTDFKFQLTLFEKNGVYAYYAYIYPLSPGATQGMGEYYRDFFSWDYSTLEFDNGKIIFPIPSLYNMEENNDYFARLKATPDGVDPYFMEIKFYGDADTENKLFNMTVSDARNDKKAQGYFASRLKTKDKKEIRVNDLNTNLSKYIMGGTYSEHALDEKAGLVRREYFAMLKLNGKNCSISIYQDFHVTSTSVKDMFEELEEYKFADKKPLEQSRKIYFYEWYAYALKNVVVKQ